MLKTKLIRPSKATAYRVINHIGTINVYEHLVTKEIKDFYVKLLSEYKHDEVNSNVNKAAKLDDEYVDIAGVHGHKFVPSTLKKRTNLRFLLTWEDDMDPNWYPWDATLGKNKVIHEYLDEHRMRMYISLIYTFPKDHPEEVAWPLKRKKGKTKTK